MQFFLQLSEPVQLTLLALLGLFVGGQVNRGIYRLAWDVRDIGPFSPLAKNAPPRKWSDYLPVVGWIGLRRESKIHGDNFWIRPLLIEVIFGLGFVLLFDWEMSGGLVPDKSGSPPVLPTPMFLLSNVIAHLFLISMMAVASFIDIDEKTIPDEITVPGTLGGLLLAMLLPTCLLPEPFVVSVKPFVLQTTALHIGSPVQWPALFDRWPGLVIGMACFAGWVLAISPTRIWTRSGVGKAITYLVAGFLRYKKRYLVAIAIGWCVIAACWYAADQAPRFDAHWQSLLSALVGMAFGGGVVWSVRIIGGSALGKEAMGFGDVTLMAMIGALVGWQAALIVFFLAPFAGIAIAVPQWIVTRRAEIWYGPFLCAATIVTIVFWSSIWNDEVAADYFSLGLLVPALLAVCLVMMWAMLFGWRMVREKIFPE